MTTVGKYATLGAQPKVRDFPRNGWQVAGGLGLSSRITEQQTLGVGMFWMVKNLSRRATLNHFSGVHNYNFITKFRDDAKMMRNEKGPSIQPVPVSL